MSHEPRGINITLQVMVKNALVLILTKQEEQRDFMGIFMKPYNKLSQKPYKNV